MDTTAGPVEIDWRMRRPTFMGDFMKRLLLSTVALWLVLSGCTTEEVAPHQEEPARELDGMTERASGDSSSASGANEKTGEQLLRCSATARCDGEPDVTCSLSGSSGSCSWVDRNCAAGQRGYVECGGVRTTCRAVCPVCLEGQRRTVESGSCCCDYSFPQTPEYRRVMRMEQCVNNQWVPISGTSTCTGISCDPDGVLQCAP